MSIFSSMTSWIKPGDKLASLRSRVNIFQNIAPKVGLGSLKSTNPIKLFFSKLRAKYSRIPVAVLVWIATFFVASIRLVFSFFKKLFSGSDRT